MAEYTTLAVRVSEAEEFRALTRELAVTANRRVTAAETMKALLDTYRDAQKLDGILAESKSV